MLARAWYLIGKHSNDLNMNEQAYDALGRAQKVFDSSGMKEKALDIGNEMDEIKIINRGLSKVDVQFF